MATDAIKLHIIYLEDDTSARIVLSKWHYDNWRQIQDDYVAYKASLGPWTPEEVIDFFQSEYHKDHQEVITRFVASPDETMHL